jgi:hypothetical protein
MSSIKEFSKTLPKIEVDPNKDNGQFLVVVKYNGVEVANVIVSIDSLNINTANLIESEVKFTVTPVY